MSNKEYRPPYEKGRLIYADPRIPFTFPDYLGGQEWINASTKILNDYGIVPIVVLMEGPYHKQKRDAILTNFKRDPNFPSDDFLLILITAANQEESCTVGGYSGKNVSAKYSWLDASVLNNWDTAGPCTGIMAESSKYPDGWYREHVKSIVDRIIYFLQSTKRSGESEPVVEIPQFLTPPKAGPSLANRIWILNATTGAILTATGHYEPLIWGLQVLLCAGVLLLEYVGIGPINLRRQRESRMLHETMEKNITRYKELVMFFHQWQDEAKWKLVEVRNAPVSPQTLVLLQGIDTLVDALENVLSQAHEQLGNVEDRHNSGKDREALKILNEEIVVSPQVRTNDADGSVAVSVEVCKPANRAVTLLSAANSIKTEIDARFPQLVRLLENTAQEAA